MYIYKYFKNEKHIENIFLCCLWICFTSRRIRRMRPITSRSIRRMGPRFLNSCWHPFTLHIGCIWQSFRFMFDTLASTSLLFEHLRPQVDATLEKLSNTDCPSCYDDPYFWAPASASQRRTFEKASKTDSRYY